MKFMLDTNICIHLIKHRPQRLMNRFDRTPVGDIGISAITLAELEYGVAKSSRPDRNRDALAGFVSPLFCGVASLIGLLALLVKWRTAGDLRFN